MSIYRQVEIAGMTTNSLRPAKILLRRVGSRHRKCGFPSTYFHKPFTRKDLEVFSLIGSGS